MGYWNFKATASRLTIGEMASPPSVAQTPSRGLWRDCFIALLCGSAHRTISILLFLVALFGSAGLAQTKKGTASADHLELIARATANELHALKSPTPFQFQERLEWIWGTETRSVIETPEGRADRIMLFGDEPLTPDQQGKQEHRLKKLLSDRDAVKEEMRDQKAETERRIRMVQAFPKAFFFDFTGREKDLLRFDFYPNPEFSPKDRETQMYRGMEGSMLVEPVQERIVQVQGKLVKDVSFGWGVFGRLSKGGIYEIVQTQLSPGIWRITTLNVDVKGRIFLLNSFRFMRMESDSRYCPVQPPMTYQSAVKILLAAPPLPEKCGRNGSPAPAPSHGNQRPGHSSR